MPLMQHVGRQPEILLPVSGESNTAKVAAGGMAADIKAAGVAAVTRRILESPGDSAPHLIGHHADVAVRAADIDEIKSDVIHPGVDKQLGRIAVILSRAGPPGAAMDEHEDRRIGCPGGIEIERFDRRRPVSEPLRRAETAARLVAARGITLENLPQQRSIDALIVGGVELGLVEVHPDVRSLVMLGRPDCAIGKGGRCRQCSRAGIVREGSGP